MPVSNIKFPNRPGYASENSDFIAYAGIRYKKAQVGTTYSFSNPIPVSLTVNANVAGDPFSEWMDVFRYSNKVTLQYRYKLWITEDSMTTETYHLAIEARVKKYDGSTFSLSATTDNITVTNGVAYRTPFLNSYFIIGGIVFFTTNNPTAADEPATGGAGTWFLMVSQTHTAIDPAPLSGEMTAGQYGGGYREVFMYTGYSDSSYDQTVANLRNWGDGQTDPSQPGTPSPDYDPTKPQGGDKPTYGPDDGDPIDFPALPTVGVFSTGLVSAYKPTLQELQSLASELWNTSFEQSISKILNDPFDGIISLSMLPFDITAGSPTAIKIGNYQSGVNAAKVNGQYIKISGGSITIPQAWYNFLDYTQTKVDIFIPFVGIVPIQIDDCMGKQVTLEYNIDLFSGAGVACLKCKNSVLYTYPVNVAYQVPLTGSNKAALFTGLINIGMSAVTGGLHGGAGGAILGASASAISTATTKQSDVQRSGALSSNTGILGELNAYVILHRPVQALPTDFKQFKGYTSNIMTQLSTLSGYTEVEYIHLENVKATDTELKEIEDLLKSGVII